MNNRNNAARLGSAAPKLPFFQQRKELFLVLKIQMIGRLIEYQDLWILGKELCQEDPLQFAAGKCQDRLTGKWGKTGQFQGFFDLFFVIGRLGRK